MPAVKIRFPRLSIVVSALMLAGVAGLPSHPFGSSVAAANQAYQPLSFAQMPTHMENRLTTGARHNVVILLGGPHGTRSRTSARDDAMVAQQRPLVAQLHSIKARYVHSFRVIDAVSAKVTTAEVRYLKRTQGVVAVVPNHRVTLPKLNYGANLKSQMRTATSHPANLATCSPDKTLLEPQALQLTHAAFADPSVPQAQSIATGTGVTVAYIADGLNIFNPDFFRPSSNGKPGPSVFADYQDFSGEGLNTPTSGGEAFGDASSIAAQGNQTYDVNKFVAKNMRAANPCHIRIMGVAPGASLMGLNIFGRAFTYETTVMQAVQYAVTHGANVINQSLGFYPYPDNNRDPLTLADNAAVDNGVTVVVSSGDSGAGDTLGSPASDPKVIAVGATTQFQSYAQLEYGGQPLGSNGFIDNNISGFSSSGATENNAKAVDVVAPGDLGWALCTASIEYEDCTNFQGRFSNIELFGGTSESSPLTAGEAALVIQAYRDSHAGASPSPQIVKEIITSTATDLGLPSFEQGAGLINCLKAVEAAQWNNATSTATGSTILRGPETLSATASTGSALSFPITVRNTGTTAQVVAPQGMTQSASMGSSTQKLKMNPTKDPRYVGAFGKWAYVSRDFTVPAGATRFQASISFNSEGYFGIPYLTLVSPTGQFAAFSIPQGYSGYQTVDIRLPAAGVWKAYIWTAPQKYAGYHGTVILNMDATQRVPWGTVSPVSRTLQPGAVGHFTFNVTTPSTAGDQNGEIVFGPTMDPAADTQAGALPVMLRSLVPITDGSGTFSGNMVGGNGRGTGQTLTYDFDVPAGETDLDLGLTMNKADFAVAGYLMDPSGLCRGSHINEAIYKQPGQKRAHVHITNTMQFFAHAPAAGQWRFVLVVYENLAGREAQGPFTGSIGFNGAKVKSQSVPDSASMKIAPGTSQTATVTITNTGNARENYFVDPRENTMATLHPKWMVDAYGEIAPTKNSMHLPDDPFRGFIVPPLTSRIAVKATATYPNVPIESELVQTTGGEYSPDIAGHPYVDGSGNNDSYVAINRKEVPFGFWYAMQSTIGPYFSPSPWVSVHESIAMNTLAFDPSVQTSKTNVWQEAIANPFGRLTTLHLAPGQSGTITVTFSPGSSVSGAQAGTLNIDTWDPFTDSGDEVSVIPYSYTAGS